MAQQKRAGGAVRTNGNDNRELDLSLADMKRNSYPVGYQEYRTRQTQKSKHAMVAQRRELRRRKLRRIKRAAIVMITVTGIICVVIMFPHFAGKSYVDGNMIPVGGADDGIFGNSFNNKVQGISAKAYAKHPQWTEDFLTPNEYSRPGDPLKQVNNVFVHYTANKGTSAAQNRSYFEQLKDNHERSASAHFIIGYEGEILQCIPLDEIAYAVQTRNFDSVSIECCYQEEDGSFTQETYDSLIKLLRWLLDTYDLEEEDILRHYDCGGKLCPLYYAEHEDAWAQLKKDVKAL